MRVRHTAAERKYRGQGHPERETLSVDEAIARYEGKWVLMQVTGFNERQDPTAGEIVGVWPLEEESERTISRTFAQIAGSQEKPPEPYYLFEARPSDRPQQPHQATGDLLARVAAVIGKQRARCQR